MTATFDQIRTDRTWAVRLLQPGGQDRRGCVWLPEAAPSLLPHFSGRPVPVAANDPLGHLPEEELRQRGGPNPAAVIGAVTWAGMSGDEVVGQITLVPEALGLHETLLRCHAAGVDLPELSLQVTALTEPMLVRRPDPWLGRTLVSEGMQPCITAATHVWCVDLVERALAGGKFLFPTSAAGARYGGERVGSAPVRLRT